MDPQSHAALRELLPSYAASQLTTSERAAVERHIATCADCRAELGEWLTLGDWLAQADAAIPPDTGAAQGLAALHARLRQLPAHHAAAHDLNDLDSFERSALSHMSNHSAPRYTHDSGDTQPAASLYERRLPTGPSYSAPPTTYPPQPPQRRVSALVAGGAALAFLALAAVLFYLLAPQVHPRNNVANQPSATGTWHVSASAPAHTATMKFAPTAPQTGYLCAITNPVPSSPRWLYKTTDGGKTWRPLSGVTIPRVGQPASMTCDIFINASDANDVFAQLLLSKLEGSPQALSEALWRSRDGGRSWSQVHLPLITNGWAYLVAAPGSRIVALAAYTQQVPPVCGAAAPTAYPRQLDDLYASDNGGATWTKIGQSLTSQGASVVAAGLGGSQLASAGDTLFAQTYCAAGQSASGQHANWKSTDGGATWSKVALPSDAYIVGFTRATSGGYAGVAVKQGNGTDHSPSTALPVVYFSADTGASWKALPALSGMPGLHPVTGYTNIMWATALPDGAVLAAVNVYDSSFAVKSSGLFAIDPHSANPTWRRFASFSNQTPLGIANTSHGPVLWALSPSANPSATPTVVYLSPLP